MTKKRSFAKAKRRMNCATKEYKRLLREMLKWPESKRPRGGKVPKHLRAAIKSHARRLAKVKCGLI